MEKDFTFQVMTEGVTHIKYVKLTDIIKYLDVQINAFDPDASITAKEALEHMKSQFINFL